MPPRTASPEVCEDRRLSLQPVDLCANGPREDQVRGVPTKLAELVLEMLLRLAGSIPASPLRLELRDKLGCCGHSTIIAGLAVVRSRPAYTASFSSLAGRNATFLLALILMASPVAGLRPILAARFRT